MKSNIQIVALSLLLMGVVFSIYKLQTTGIDPTIFFLEDKTTSHKGLTQPSRGQMHLCKTRISKIKWRQPHDTYLIFQEGTSWFYSKSIDKDRADPSLETQKKTIRNKKSEPLSTELANQKRRYPDLEMEKWLGEFCTVRIDAFYEEKTEPPDLKNESITLYFINGSDLTLQLRRPWILWNQEWVKSSEMIRALSELQTPFLASPP